MPRILIAEDDHLISSFIEKGLRARGYSTHVVDDGEEATRLSLSDGFDLLILDMALPGREGFRVLQRIRAEGRRLPVVVLTGRPDLRDAVQSLDDGADDYMTKPFRFEELLARIRARLRTPRTAEIAILDVAGVRLEVLARRAVVDGRVIELTAREFALLELHDAPSRSGPHAFPDPLARLGVQRRTRHQRRQRVHRGAAQEARSRRHRVRAWHRLLHAHSPR